LACHFKADGEASDRLRSALGALAIRWLSLDGRLQQVFGAMATALKAAELGKDLYCPEK